jgi:cobalt-zinc-cadmium efflux system protein
MPSAASTHREDVAAHDSAGGDGVNSAHRHRVAPSSMSSAFAWGVGLNTAFVIAEVVTGFLSHSLALIADAGHNVGDILGLMLAWGAAVLARHHPTPRRTYGLRRSTILAALVNGVLLMTAVGAVAWEAIRRLVSGGPNEVAAGGVMALAAAGVVVNGVSAWLFARGRHEDVNVRAVFLHLIADAAVSVGVVAAGAIIWWTGSGWIDPAVSLIVSAVIAVSSWRLLRQSFDLATDAVPEGIDPAEVRECLLRLPGVIEVHDLHVWAVSTTETALTAHLARSGGAVDGAFLRDAARALHERFRISHTTIQVEPPDAHPPHAPGQL